MRREDSSIYEACLDETLKVLRTIEFMKTAIVYKSNNQKDVFTNVFGTNDATHSISDIPDIIRALKYTGAPAGTAGADIGEGGVIKTSTDYVGKPHGTSDWLRMEFHVVPHFPFNANNFRMSGGKIQLGDNTFAVHDISSSFYSVQGIATMDFGKRQSPNLQIEYIYGEGYKYVTPYEELQTVNIPGLFRGFKAKYSPRPSEASFESIGCHLTSITIPKYLTNLGEYCFYNAYVLNTVNIQADMTSIPDNCFGYCVSLSSINIPNSVNSIGNDAFSHCSRLYNLPLTSNQLTTIGNRAFEYCTGLRSMTFGPNVSSIGTSAFAMCSSLSSLTFQRLIPPTIALDETGNGTSFYGVATSGVVNIPNDASVGLWAEWMSSDIGAHSHLQDYSWTIQKNGVQVWPE